MRVLRHDKALMNHLRCHPLKIISHLSISVESFDITLEILSSEYLDEKYMVEQIFVTIDTARLTRDNDFSVLGIFC